MVFLNPNLISVVVPAAFRLACPLMKTCHYSLTDYDVKLSKQLY